MQVRQAEYGPAVRPPRVAPRLSVVAAGAGVLTQIAYPLLSGPALTGMTVLTVALLDVAVLAHATASFGAAAAARFAVAIGGLSLLAEAVGVHTGIPFGAYGYSGDLGVRLLGVPLVVLGAWTMMAYPCVLLARRLTVPGRTSTPLTPTGRGDAGPTVPGRASTRLRVALLGGITLASWDLFQRMATGLSAAGARKPESGPSEG